MTQLRECRARDHAPEGAKVRIGTDGPSQSRVPQIDRRKRLHGFCERHIVDERAADRLDSADSLQRLTSKQNRPACGGGYRRGGIIHSRERIEHLKEIDEGRHQSALGEARAIQSHHLADHGNRGLCQPCHKR